MSSDDNDNRQTIEVSPEDLGEPDKMTIRKNSKDDDRDGGLRELLQK